jgi:hypothetical protein
MNLELDVLSTLDCYSYCLGGGGGKSGSHSCVLILTVKVSFTVRISV